MNKPKQKTAQWKLKNDCSIYEVSEMHQKLQTLLQKATTTTLDLSAVEHVDASFLQLLIAAHNEALNNEAQLRVKDPSECLIDLADKTYCQQALREDDSSLTEEVNANEPE